MEPTGEEIALWLQTGLPDPRFQGIHCSLRYLELQGALNLVLHDDRTPCRSAISRLFAESICVHSDLFGGLWLLHSVLRSMAASRLGTKWV